jgi:hypothetical protein
VASFDRDKIVVELKFVRPARFARLGTSAFEKNAGHDANAFLFPKMI